MIVEVSFDQDPRDPLTLSTLPVSQRAHHLQQSMLGVNNLTENHNSFSFLWLQTNLCQFLSSEVERDSLCVSRVVDFDVDLVIVFVLTDQSRLQTGHLVLLPVDQNLQTQKQKPKLKGT